MTSYGLKQAVIQELEEQGVIWQALEEDVGKDYGAFDLICHVVNGQPLQADVSAYGIAKQCGTSESMIEQFYDHVRPLQKAENLQFKDVKPGQGMESWLLSNG